MTTIDLFRKLLAAQCAQKMSIDILGEPENIVLLEEKAIFLEGVAQGTADAHPDTWERRRDELYEEWVTTTNAEQEKVDSERQAQIALREFVRSWQPGSEELRAIRRSMLSEIGENIRKASITYAEPLKLTPEQWHGHAVMKARGDHYRADQDARRAKARALIRLEARTEYDTPTRREGATPEEQARALADRLESESNEVLYALTELLVERHGQSASDE